MTTIETSERAGLIRALELYPHQPPPEELDHEPTETLRAMLETAIADRARENRERARAAVQTYRGRNR